jgi:DNA-binding transcriptional LysR family regulator
MDLELRLVRSFIAVAEERHFGRAAVRLHLSQPALSRQVRELEARVGGPLLERGPAGVRLTDAGRVLLAEGEQLVAHADRALDRTQRAARGEVGHLRIGFLGSTADRTLAPLLRAMRDTYPEVTFTLTERFWPDRMAGLENDEDDVALVRDVPPGGPWRTVTLLRENQCVVMPESHPLARRRRLYRRDLRTLAQTPFITSHQWITGREPAWGFTPEVVEVASLPATCGLVRAGVGVSVMSHSYASLAPDGVAFVPVAGESTRQQLVWPRDGARPAVQRFVELARAWTPPRHRHAPGLSGSSRNV